MVSRVAKYALIYVLYTRGHAVICPPEGVMSHGRYVALGTLKIISSATTANVINNFFHNIFRPILGEIYHEEIIYNAAVWLHSIACQGS